MLFPGQVYEAAVTVHNSALAPSSATLTISKPDGTTEPHTGPWTWAQQGSDWTASYDYTLPAPGLYSFTWVTTGPGAAPRPEYINVRGFISVVSMAEIYQHLNKNSARAVASGDDDELGGYLQAATELIEDKVGICVSRPFTARVDARPGDVRLELVVPDRPVLSVQSVTSIWAGGPVWTPPTIACDGEAGLIYQPSLMQFYWGPWDVATTCGRPVIKEKWIHAAKEQVRHLYETQRGSMAPALLQGEEVFTATTGFTFSVPRRVLELLEQDMVPSI